MAKLIATREHQWVSAQLMPLDKDTARLAAEDGALLLESGMDVDILEVYCRQCRVNFDDAADEPCVVATEGNEHLRGGPVGVRRQRRCPEHKTLYTECGPRHISPIDYGRPPMPTLLKLTEWHEAKTLRRPGT